MGQRKERQGAGRDKERAKEIKKCCSGEAGGVTRSKACEEKGRGKGIRKCSNAAFKGEAKRSARKATKKEDRKLQPCGSERRGKAQGEIRNGGRQ